MPTSISVIVPVYNDPDGVALTIESLCRQRYSAASYEILVVDNGSTDQTLTVIDRYRDAYPDLVVPLSERTIQSSYAARNVGIRHANGSVLVFLDADMTVPPTYLDDVASALSEGTNYLGCELTVYYPAGRDTYVAQYNKVMMGDNERNIREFGFVPTSSLSVCRAVMDEVQGFDDRLISSGDVLFGRQAAKAGHEPEYVPSITAYHPARTSLRSKLERDVRIGRGLAQRSYYHPDEFSTRPFYALSEYLPPRPNRVKRRLKPAAERAAVDLTLDAWFIFYFLYYLQIVARVTAKRSEEVRIRLFADRE